MRHSAVAPEIGGVGGKRRRAHRLRIPPGRTSAGRYSPCCRHHGQKKSFSSVRVLCSPQLAPAWRHARRQGAAGRGCREQVHLAEELDVRNQPAGGGRDGGAGSPAAPAPPSRQPARMGPHVPARRVEGAKGPAAPVPAAPETARCWLQRTPHRRRPAGRRPAVASLDGRAVADETRA